MWDAGSLMAKRFKTPVHTDFFQLTTKPCAKVYGEEKPEVVESCTKIDNKEECEKKIVVDEPDENKDQTTTMCKWRESEGGRFSKKVQGNCNLGDKCRLPRNLKSWDMEQSGGDSGAEGGDSKEGGDSGGEGGGDGE